MKNIFSSKDATDKHVGVQDVTTDPDMEAEQASEPKTSWGRLWPVFACGAGLFSDGFLNNIIGSVGTILSTIYPTEYASSPASSNVSSIAFAGTVVGMLGFGWTSDMWSRKWSLVISTVILFVFAALAAGSYGAGGTINGMLAALTAYRFFIGVGIGGEYPAGSVACAEATGDLKSGSRNRWFVLFTNNMIDIGFVVSAFAPMIVVLATTEKHLRAAWRICLGLGIIPPLSLIYLRLKLKEPESFKRQKMGNVKTTPWILIIKFYWFRLATVSLIWFIYDFSSYSFGIYSSTITANLLGSDTALWKSFGWNTLINLFYLPGSISGAFISDWLGPKKTLAYGVTAQAIVGFILAGCYGILYKPEYVGGFVVVYGVFLALGELGPGDNIGLIASKTCASAIRGRYYGIAAALGKIGAYVGTKVLGILYNRYSTSDPVKAGQLPVYISSAMCVLSALIAWFLLPEIGQDTIQSENARFHQFLVDSGYDVSQIGVHSDDDEQVVRESSTEGTIEETAEKSHDR